MNKQDGEQKGFVATLFAYAFVVILLCKHEPWLVAVLRRKKKNHKLKKKNHRLKLQSDSDIPSAPTTMYAPET